MSYTMKDFYIGKLPALSMSNPTSERGEQREDSPNMHALKGSKLSFQRSKQYQPLPGNVSRGE